MPRLVVSSIIQTLPRMLNKNRNLAVHLSSIKNVMCGSEYVLKQNVFKHTVFKQIICDNSVLDLTCPMINI